MTADIPHSTFDIRRVGCVNYLNSKPLIYGIESQVHLDTPSNLARMLRSGEIDCGLAPVVEYFEHPHYQILPSISISSRGPVRSVVLAYRGPLSAVKRVELDPNSRTSSLLLQVVLGEFFGLDVEYVSVREPSREANRLIIGDPALFQRGELQESGWNLLDLGESWYDTMELPFVFACWLVREGVNPEPYGELLSRARNEGLAHIEEIIAAEKRLPAKMLRAYFRDAVRYELGAEEQRGMDKFRSLLAKRGLL